VVALSNRLLPGAEFLRAYRELFGGSPTAAESLLALGRLDNRALKQAYRRRAQATHPDRAHLRSTETLCAHAEFQAVVGAYELLKLVRDGALRVDVPLSTPKPSANRAQPQARTTPVRPARPKPEPDAARPGRQSQRAPGDCNAAGAQTHRGHSSAGWRDSGDGTATQPRNQHNKANAEGDNKQSSFASHSSRFCPQSDHYFERAIPTRQLPFGQFLYYAGQISWKQLIDALVWQRQQRPPIGQLARRWGMLTEWQVEAVLESRHTSGRYDVRFADYAHEMGYLSASDLTALIGRMKMLQKPIGQYFIEAGVFDAMGLAQLLTAHRRHNWRAVQQRARAG